MKFLDDAQLPKRLATQLNQLNHDARHTYDLSLGNRTGDDEIARIADQDGAVVVTKDLDFLDAHLLRGSPAKLLMVSTGKISNRVLLELFEAHIALIVDALHQSNLVELNQSGLMVHDA
ncbi:MAG: hypothetical protein EA425_17185 [Puniceicoccaceae bacterium]|nr:MAG: hypothetical protein EA425_17185 [Puniceicoccaceae bacterium]